MASLVVVSVEAETAFVLVEIRLIWQLCMTEDTEEAGETLGEEEEEEGQQQQLSCVAQIAK